MRLLSPPVVPSQCCALGVMSVAGHCRDKCIAHTSRYLYTGNLDSSLSLAFDETLLSQQSSTMTALSGLSTVSSPSFSALTTSTHSSPPSSCLSTSPPAYNGSMPDWNFTAWEKQLDHTAFPQQQPCLRTRTQTHYQPVQHSKHTDANAGQSENDNEVSADADGTTSTTSTETLFAKSVDRARDSIVCDVPGCHRLFANVYNLNDHRRTHVRPRERRHACPLHGCPKKYFYRRDLVRHLRKHHSATDLLPLSTHPHTHRSHTHKIHHPLT